MQRSSPRTSPRQSPRSAPNAVHGGLALPRTGLIWYAPNGVDTIGLSANALWDALPSYMRSIYLTDRNTLKSAATIAANIADSGFLNVGGGLLGNATKGYAQYQDGTSADILDKAARYYKETYGWPTDIKSLVIASGGELDAPVGPSVSYSAAAGQVPDGLGGVQSSTSAPVHSAGYYGGPAYTNILLQSEDFYSASWTKVGCSVDVNQALSPFGALTADKITFTGTSDVNNRCYQDTAVLSVNGTKVTGSVWLWSDAPKTIRLTVQRQGPSDTEYVTCNLTTTPQRFCITHSGVFSGTSVLRLNINAPSEAGIVYAWGAQLVVSPYCFEYLPTTTTTTSVVSTVGTTTGNGVSVPLTGSDAADRLKDCFEGPNGNDAVGTVAVLMKMGASASEIPNSTILNWLSVKDASSELLFTSTGSSGEDNIGNSNDGATTAAVAATAWTRDQYLLLAVEYSLTKFRVGAQRYSSAGVAVDANPVWSHATLAGGATFDGSFNPTTFLRWFLNSTVPNWMRCHFVSNQAELGDSEIIRRIRKYGQF